VLSLCEQTDDTAGHKPRIHPKEAGHRIDDLPSQSQVQTESEKLSAAELVKSLGLQVNGVGRNAELWYVGSGEQQEVDDLPLSETEGVELPNREKKSLVYGPGEGGVKVAERKVTSLEGATRLLDSEARPGHTIAGSIMIAERSA
jgi:hypothetical protein